MIVRNWESLSRELMDAAGVGWDNPVNPADREVYFGDVVRGLMRDIVRDELCKPRFDALVVDEAHPIAEHPVEDMRRIPVPHIDNAPFVFFQKAVMLRENREQL